MHDPLLLLADRVAIQQLLSAYTIGVCRADWDRVLATFAADAVWEAPAAGILARGPLEIRAALSVHVARMDHFIQIASPAAIEVAGDRATALSSIRENGRFAADGSRIEVFGIYEDLLARGPQGWRFVRRTFLMAAMDGSVIAPDEG